MAQANFFFLRDERKLSQQRLADEFGVAQTQIHSYEKGEYEPDISILNKYADFFDVSVDFVIGRTTHRRNPVSVKEYELSEDEQTLVDTYREMLKSQRHHLVSFLASLKEK